MPPGSRNPAEFDGGISDRESIVVASDRLEDASALTVNLGPRDSEALSLIKVAQRFREAMKRASGPGPREEDHPLGRRIVHELLRQFFGLLSVLDAAEQVSAESNQCNAGSLAADLSAVPPRPAAPDHRAAPAGSASRGHPPSWGIPRSSSQPLIRCYRSLSSSSFEIHEGFQFWWIRFGRSKVGEDARGGHRRVIDPVSDPRAVAGVDEEGEEGVHDVIVE